MWPFSFRPLVGSGLIGLSREPQELLSVFLHVPVNGRFSEPAFRQDNFCQFPGVGGFRYRWARGEIVSVQGYGVWKRAFFRRNHVSHRQGPDVVPLDVFNQAKSYLTRVDHMGRSLLAIATSNRSYAARLEFRVTSTINVTQELYNIALGLSNYIH